MKIVVSSGENVLAFSPETPLCILEGGLVGFDGAEVQIDSKTSADGMGCVVTGKVYPLREMKIRFEIGVITWEEDAIWRERIRRTSVPGVECLIKVESHGIIRKIGAIPTVVRFERDTESDLTVAEIAFAASELFFSDGEAISGEIAVDNGDTTVVNSGEVPCGAVFSIRADGGTVVNPSVSCGDKTVWFSGILSDGDELVIDTRWGKKAVRVNGEERLTFDLRSSFSSLAVGENAVSSHADSGKEFMAVSYEIMPLYFGI